MIKLNVNNNRTIEMSQGVADGKIGIDIVNSQGLMEKCYTISAGDMVMLLNYYQDKKDRGEEIY